jgi:phosphatidylethanolamine/phosphatidyl-N-methylethanolamine N-methyltransferase
VRHHLRFFNLWLKKPGQLGAIFPSSKNLAAVVAAEIDPSGEGLVVELGGGTGSVTAALLHRGIPPRDLVVIEREDSLCKIIRERFPHVRVICGDACDLGHLLASEGLDHVKAIVSGLPLLSLPKQVERAIVKQCFNVLPADGFMLQFTYSPRPPMGRAIALELDLEATRCAFVLENLPPASVWTYRRRCVNVLSGHHLRKSA